MKPFQQTYLHKAVIGGEVVSHRIPPALVVSFEEGEQSTDLLQDLEIKQKHQYGFSVFQFGCALHQTNVI